MQAVENQHEQGERQKFTFSVDDREFTTEKAQLTGGQIMDMADIPHSQGLLLINDDGTQVKIEVGDIIDLKPGQRFKKKPRFKRGRHE